MRYKFNKNSMVGFCNRRFQEKPLDELAAYCLDYIAVNEIRYFTDNDNMLFWKQDVFSSKLLQELFIADKGELSPNPYSPRSSAPNSLKTPINAP